MPATAHQIKVWQWHKQVSTTLGIGVVTLGHRALKGTVTNQGLNKVYKGPGPVTAFTFSATYQIYWITQDFLRGQQRQDDFAIGTYGVPLLEAQCSVLDNSQNVISMAQDDLITDANGAFWRVVNPVVSPDAAYWTFMSEQLR